MASTPGPNRLVAANQPRAETETEWIIENSTSGAQYHGLPYRTTTGERFTLEHLRHAEDLRRGYLNALHLDDSVAEDVDEKTQEAKSQGPKATSG